MAQNLGLKKQSAGRAAEEFVAAFLERNGCQILARNYQVFSGEVDLIAADKETLIFVEVKYRHKADTVVGYLVPFKKQSKIIGAARRFMAEYKRSAQLVCRFDVAALVRQDDGRLTLTYIPNAFVAP